MAGSVVLAIFLVMAVIGGLAIVLYSTSGRDHRGGGIAYGLQILGDPTGRTEADFVAAFGANPTSISQAPYGQRLLQWQQSGQHLAVLFGPDNRFIQISHRHGV